MADLDNLRAAERELTAEIERAENRLLALRAERREVRRAAVPVSVGEIVRLTCNRYRGEEALVRLIDEREIGYKAWLHVSRKRKDGSWSEQRIHAFTDWEVIK